MQTPSIRITTPETTAARDDRFHRLRLIEWWDQPRLARAKVLVVGAGALGNEIVKNLALLGVGNVLVADMDRVENSNLSRSVLYRASDNGRPKAEVAAEAARHIYPDIRAAAFVGNVIHGLGMGAFRWADIVLGGLDNREARLAINRHCYRLGRPWIDGAIEQIQGCARVFVPDGPCYECTMGEVDWKIVNHRRSCNLLSRAEMESGRTPTTPTISSIIAGVECQEAVKLLHGMPAMAGEGWFFEGLSGDSYRTAYQRKEDCLSHDPFEQVVALGAGAADITAAEALARARGLLGPSADIELARDVLSGFLCRACESREPMFTAPGTIPAERARCPTCGATRDVETFYKLTGDESFLDRPLAELGVPRWDILIARVGARSIGLELDADAASVLGPLAAGQDDVEWT